MSKKTYAVHYGDQHLSRCKVMDDDFRSLSAAKDAARERVEAGYSIVIIADTDGNEWDMTETD